MKCYQICKWNSNVGCVKPYGVTCKLENVPSTDKKATNADRIRAMSDEELAEVIACPKGLFDRMDCFDDNRDCKHCALEWLQKPAEEG